MVKGNERRWLGPDFYTLTATTYKATRLLLHISIIAIWGWLGEGKVSWILCHLGAQLILAYSWARPAVLAAGMGRGRMFLFFLFHHFLSFSSFSPIPLFYLLFSLFYLFSPFLWETTQNDPQGLTCRETPTQSISQSFTISKYIDLWIYNRNKQRYNWNVKLINRNDQI